MAQELGAAPIRGVGGTRTADWWFTDRAVLIDTAGRYTTQDSHEPTDAKAWNGFLDLLKRYRPRQPLTGVLVALPAPDLLAADEGEVQAHARAVRARVDEIGRKFGVRVPVYVLLTKTDLLAGFTESSTTWTRRGASRCGAAPSRSGSRTRRRRGTPARRSTPWSSA